MKKLSKPSRVIGPEDVRRGQYVTLTHATYELLVDRCGMGSGQELKTGKVTIIPYEAGHPLKVVSVCLPFVLVVDMNKRHRTLDLRRQQIARLSKAFGKRAFKAIAKQKTGYSDIF